MPNTAGEWVIQGGATAIVAAIVWLVLTGRLVPRTHVADLRADKDARIAELIAERDTWRAAHSVSEEARQAALGHNAELLELSRTADAVLRILPRGEVGHAPVDAPQD